MAVRIAAKNLGTEGLELELPGSGTRLVFGPSGGLSGTYDQDAERLALRELRAERFLVTELASTFAAGAVRLEAPCRLERVSVDGELRAGAGFAGKAAAGRAAFERVHLELGGWQIHAQLDLTQLRLSSTGSGGEAVRIDHAELRDVELRNGAVRVTVQHAALAALELGRGQGGDPTLGTASVAIEGLSVERSGATVALDDLKLPNGVRFERGGLALAALEIGKLVLGVPDVGAVASGGTRGSKSAPPKAARSEERSRTGGMPALPFLDHLHGNLQLDVEVDLRLPLPIIKSRRATHRVRLPIDGGTIDYKQLESSLSGLENALLDFEISDAGLILERDLIPGVSFDNQTLVTWPLPPEELGVAKRERRVRLRRLFDYQLDPKLTDKGESSEQPPGDGDDTERSGFLRRLDITNIDVSLSVNAQSELSLGDLRLRLGAGTNQPLRRLRLQGEVHIASEEDRAPTELRLALSDLQLGLEVPLGDRRLHIAELRVGQIDEAVLRVQNLRAGSLAVRAGPIGAADVEVSGQGG